ncbi:hypothetical protein MMC08_002177, partial [Hypocenomyce scalaris]|nr:hypothetical protein [Hypocenomyce scalaris]
MYRWPATFSKLMFALPIRIVTALLRRLTSLQSEQSSLFSARNLHNDKDSAYGGSSDSESNFTSINSSVRDYRNENGRTYHAYKDGIYHLPNDEIEASRL